MPKHIIRLVVLIVVGAAAGLLAKWYFTAESFYEYGHYRANSVPEIAAQDPVYQTPRYCQPCHSERHAQWSANSHKTVICEVCHGAAQGHPQKGKLPIPVDSVKLCTFVSRGHAGKAPHAAADRPRGTQLRKYRAGSNAPFATIPMLPSWGVS